MPVKFDLKADKERGTFIEDLRRAVYTTCLAAYVQGMSIIDVADKQNKWAIDFGMICQIWRSGCIIQADHISDLLRAIFHPENKSPHKNHNLLFEPTIVEELKTGFEPLKRLVAKGVEVNAIIPSMSATLEWLKYSGNLELPTQFYEAELDYFGKHMYDSKAKDSKLDSEWENEHPDQGKRHYEWKPA